MSVCLGLESLEVVFWLSGVARSWGAWQFLAFPRVKVGDRPTGFGTHLLPLKEVPSGCLLFL